MTKLSDAAEQLLVLAMRGEQGVLGDQRISRTSSHPGWCNALGNKQFTIMAGGHIFYEEEPGTEHEAKQAKVAVDELHDAGLIEVETESEDKKRQRFRITPKGVAVCDQLTTPARWIGRGEAIMVGQGLRYSDDEIVLCTYIARFGRSQFDESVIHGMGLRSLPSIKAKVQNIAFMLNEKGHSYHSSITPLSGTPGEGGRETNWDIVRGLVGLSESEHRARCFDIVER